MDRRRFVVVAGVGAAWFASGCYWQRYPRLVRTHLELLSDYAAKLQGLADDHVVVPAERWGEFTYPLDRARDFSRIVAGRWPGRSSLAAFDRAVEAYAALVADPVILSRPDAMAEVARRREILDRSVAETRAALAAEEGSVSGAA